MNRIVRSVVRTPCVCGARLLDSERHCISCGGFNPHFTMEAYEKDAPNWPFGADCQNSHQDLLLILVEFPTLPCCSACGYNILTGKPPDTTPKQAPT